MTPQVFGEYLLVRRLVQRSMAEVFLAVRLGDRSGRIVVLKRAPIDAAPSGSIAESLRREVEVLRDGRIDGIVELADSGEVAGLPFVVLEHLKGQPLDALLTAGALDRGAALLLGRDVARGLAALHARGWIHGDVTPSNILVDDAGEATLIDLGIARRLGEAREMPAGKPGYASPEAAIGKPASASDDIYGWGVVIAECLLGARLFRETDLAEAAARSQTLPLAVEETPLVAAALRLDPQSRPRAEKIVEGLSSDPDKRDFLANAVLSAELRSGPQSAVPPGRTSSDQSIARATVSDPAAARMAQAWSERPLGPRRETRWWLGAILGVSFAAAIIGGFLAGRRTAPKDTRDTTLTLPPVGPRAEVKIDGRTLLSPNPSRKVPIEPGAHKLSIQINKREPREYEFVAEAGDHIVILMPRNRKQDKDGSGNNPKGDQLSPD